MVQTGEPPAAIVESHGMKQVSDTTALETLADEVLVANPAKVAEYRNGKTGLLGFFVGQVMKATQGQANPQLINEVIARKLES
jgi:Asp-tRNA(Asn)/Glu-tRNA(Gln) amidotransferase B subunit